MQVIGFEYSVFEPLILTCLFRSTESQPLNIAWSREAGGRVTTSSLNGTITGDCGVTLTLSGSGGVSPSTTVTLI